MKPDKCINGTIQSTFLNSILDPNKQGSTTYNTMIPCKNKQNTVPYNPPNIILNSNNGNTNNDFYLTSSTIGVYNSSYSNTGIMEVAERNPLKNGISQNNWDLGNFNIPNVNSSGSNQNQIINKTPSYTINTNGTNTNSTAVYMVGQENAFAFDKFKVHLEHRFDNPVHYAQTLNFSDFPALSGITKCGDYVTSNIARWIDLKSTGNLGTNVGNKVFANFNTIKLNHNNIADDAVEPILNSFSWQTLNLTTLELSHNHLGDGFVNCFLKATSKDNGRAEHSIKNIVLHHNLIGDDGAKMFADALKSGQLPNAKYIDVSGNNITEKGWECFAASVKKVQANTIVIKVAIADTLQGMKEFLTKGFKYYTQTHKVVATKEFQDELLGANTSSCEKTKNNVLKAAYTAGFIKSLTNGNDYFILAAGAEAGAGALISPDTWDCYKQLEGEALDWMNGIE